MSVLAAAFAEAGRLGHHWVGSEHFLLALARADEQSPAGQALRAAGATHAVLAEKLEWVLANTDPPHERKPEPDAQLNPRAYGLLGRAEGFAAALAAEHPRPEHILLGLLWEPHGFAGHLLRTVGVDPARVQDHLAELGLAVPDRDPPPAPVYPPTQRVDVPHEQLGTIIAELPKLLPEGSHFGFNHDGRSRAWVFIPEELDAETLIARALAPPR